MCTSSAYRCILNTSKHTCFMLVKKFLDVVKYFRMILLRWNLIFQTCQWRVFYTSFKDKPASDCKVLLTVTRSNCSMCHEINTQFGCVLFGCMTMGLHAPWWRHQMEAFSALLALCAGNSPVTGEFTGHRWIPLTKGQWRGLWWFFSVCPHKLLNK